MIHTPRWKPPKIKQSRRSGARNSVLYQVPNDEAEESLLADFATTSKFNYISIFGYVFLVIIFTANNFGYFGSIFALFWASEGKTNDHKFIFSLFLILPSCFLMDLLGKTYIALVSYICY